MDELLSEEFAELGIKPWVIKELSSLGVTKPTPVQKGCIPRILAGDDCVAAAKTGSGKTFAFALPILQHLAEDPYGIFALVLTPTHELAYQIAEQLTIVGRPLSLRVVIVTGGTDQLEESLKLAKRPHIVVAMPGRLADHISGCDTFTLKKIKYLVMDEADSVAHEKHEADTYFALYDTQEHECIGLFGESFEEDLQTVFNALPEKRQTLMFSATLGEDLLENKILTLNRERLLTWREDSEQPTVETLDQRYVLCPAYARDVYLVQTLRSLDTKHIIIFTDTKKDCQVLSMTLNAVSIDNVCLHGYMRQRERVAALAQFRSNLKSTLVATNVAARGLDIPTVKVVINHKLPLSPNEYIHRVGRTARAGRSGMAISLLTPYDLPRLGAIEQAINTKLKEFKIDDDEAVKIFTTVSVARREQEAALDNEDFEQRKRNYRTKRWLQAGLDPDEMEKGFEEMRRKRIKTAKKAKLARIREQQLELKTKDGEHVSDNRLNSGDLDENIDASIREGLKKVNKTLMKRDDRFKDAIGKITKIKRKAENAAKKEELKIEEQKSKKTKKKFIKPKTYVKL